MKVFSFVFVFLLSSVCAQQYLDNKSCSECHETIYEEFRSSMHAKGYFNDTLHRKIADKVSTETYDCARCHMPMANNIEALISGDARPDRNNKTHTDAISCYFCHTIAYVKKAHRFNVNTKARQAENYKPTLYGRLDNPDDNDKHASVNNPIYGQKVCMGCHSHKLNENNVTIFRAMRENQDSIGCIECHMPEVSGGAEKMDKRARGRHASHRFLGIRDEAFRKTGVDINVSLLQKGIDITLTNKMEHPLIVQPARAKFLKIEVIRDGKTIWKNYRDVPSEDTQGYFAYSFKRNGRKVIIPAHATEGYAHNLNAKETKVLHYDTPALQKGDKIAVAFLVQLAKSDCSRVIDLKDESLTQPQLIKKEELKF